MCRAHPTPRTHSLPATRPLPSAAPVDTSLAHSYLFLCRCVRGVFEQDARGRLDQRSIPWRCDPLDYGIGSGTCALLTRSRDEKKFSPRLNNLRPVACFASFLPRVTAASRACGGDNHTNQGNSNDVGAHDACEAQHAGRAGEGAAGGGGGEEAEAEEADAEGAGGPRGEGVRGGVREVDWQDHPCREPRGPPTPEWPAPDRPATYAPAPCVTIR